MIKLKELLDEWTRDAFIDKSSIKNEILRIPQLHAKYIRILNEHKMASFKSKFDFDKMKNLRTEYYLGKLDFETLTKYGWEQFDLKITKTGIDTYLDSDELLTNLLQKKVYHDQVISTCESILAELKSRTFQLRAIVDYEKFLSGA